MPEVAELVGPDGAADRRYELLLDLAPKAALLLDPCKILDRPAAIQQNVVQAASREIQVQVRTSKLQRL